MERAQPLKAAALLLLLWLQTSAGYVQLRALPSALPKGAAPFARRRMMPALKARKSPLIAKDGSLNIRPFDQPQEKIDSATGKRDDFPRFPYQAPQIFCARSLEFGAVEAVGFDMDHTLAVYTNEFNKLAFESAIKLLISYGYPEEISSFEFNENHYVRGLKLDIARGYIYKPDRYGTVRQAFHGLQKLSQEEIDQAFPVNGGNQVGETAKLDCFFNFVDFSLYAQLVEFTKKHKDKLEKSYEQLYVDMRKAVHSSHNDGSIKKEVAKDPAKYIARDDALVSTLQHLRKECHKRLFLLTNSDWEYANVVMNYLTKDSGVQKWNELFQIVITDANKPQFFHDLPETMELPLKRVNPSTGEATALPGQPFNMSTQTLKQGNTFCGGNYEYLQNLLELRPGDEVLYVGDHIWADILRPKKAVGWRTCLILPEIEKDREFPDFGEQWTMLRELQAFVEQANASLTRPEPNVDAAAHQEMKRETFKLCRDLHVQVTHMMYEMLDKYHKSFSDVWGSPFKASEVDSWFAKQITDHACLYTDKVTRFGTLLPMSHLTTMAQLMPHHTLSTKPTRSSNYVHIDNFVLN